MLNKRQVMSKNSQRGNKGFTLTELIIVIAILLILATIVFPSFLGYREVTIARVCNFNCLELSKTYNLYLEVENIKHNDAIFAEFMQESGIICPRYGEISYKDGRIKCNIHSNKNDTDNGEDDDVPYL